MAIFSVFPEINAAGTLSSNKFRGTAQGHAHGVRVHALHAEGGAGDTTFNLFLISQPCDGAFFSQSHTIPQR
jgi:hypothetical protein